LGRFWRHLATEPPAQLPLTLTPHSWGLLQVFTEKKKKKDLFLASLPLLSLPELSCIKQTMEGPGWLAVWHRPFENKQARSLKGRGYLWGPLERRVQARCIRCIRRAWLRGRRRQVGCAKPNRTQGCRCHRSHLCRAHLISPGQGLCTLTDTCCLLCNPLPQPWEVSRAGMVTPVLQVGKLTHRWVEELDECGLGILG
jgi:hypothetical protein